MQILLNIDYFLHVFKKVKGLHIQNQECIGMCALCSNNKALRLLIVATHSRPTQQSSPPIGWTLHTP